MTPEFLWRFLPVGYLLTIALETLVLLFGLAKQHPIKSRLFAGAWLTACSYPIVILVLPTLIDSSQQRALYTLVAETFAPGSECLLFALAFHRDPGIPKADRVRDMVAIVAANLFSFLFGGYLLQTPLGRQLLFSLTGE